MRARRLFELESLQSAMKHFISSKSKRAVHCNSGRRGLRVKEVGGRKEAARDALFEMSASREEGLHAQATEETILNTYPPQSF